MAFLKFNKSELVNLSYSLKREIISANKIGAVCNTSIVTCNTRRYHGLLAVTLDRFGGQNYMLLSAVDESIVVNGKQFNLGIHCYGDIYEPRGHKYVVDFEADPVPTITYKVGEIVFKKSILLMPDSDQVLLKYELVKAPSKVSLILKPFLAFRNVHALTHRNDQANTSYNEIPGGASFRLYSGFPDLHLQLSSKSFEYHHSPDWYMGITYSDEYRRGFDCREDMMVPGFFEMPIEKGESIVFSASTSEIEPKGLKAQFTREVKNIEPREDFDSCLKAAASQLIAYDVRGTHVCTGFSWHEIGGLRETLISLAGLTIYNNGDVKLFEKILGGLLKDYREQLLGGCNQVESPLRVTEAVQHLISFTGDGAGAWKKYGALLKSIVNSYADGRPEARLTGNGMIWAEKPGVALSWMNAYIGGRPVTERRGWQVETNALWYNAVCFALDMESTFGKDRGFIARCADIRRRIEENFFNLFWVEARQHLADYVDEMGQNVFTRPNQLYACALAYSPVPETVQSQILRAVYRELVTTRTLSPKNPLYRSRYEGNQIDRDTATHNGCNRPWLLGPYVEASFKLYGASFTRQAQELIDGFQEDMNIHGIGAVAEIYDGDPQYMPHGAINSALSVAEILRVKYLVNKYREEEQ